jgi:hypothetical protein
MLISSKFPTPANGDGLPGIDIFPLPAPCFNGWVWR